MEILRFEPIIKTGEDALKAHCSYSARRIESIEMIYLPFSMFKYEVARRKWLGGEISDRALLLADMVGGIPINVPSQIEFEDKTGGSIASLLSGLDRSVATKMAGRGLKIWASKIAVEKADVQESAAVKPMLGEDEAARRGLWALRYDLMRIWGPFRYRSVNLVKLDGSAATIYFPYWMLYYNKGGKIHFDVLDALSGAKEGTQIKMSIANGIGNMEMGK